MTSRERVLAALNHEPVDRIPIDFGGHRSSGIMAMAYARLKEYLGIRSGNIYIYDLPQQLAIVEPAVLNELGIDVIEMGRGFMTDDREWNDWVLPDGTPCKIPNYIRVEERGGDWYLLANDGRDLAVHKRPQQGAQRRRKTAHAVRRRRPRAEPGNEARPGDGRAGVLCRPGPGPRIAAGKSAGGIRPGGDRRAFVRGRRPD